MLNAVQSIPTRKYEPAELTIHTHSAEMHTDMSQVYDDLGLKKPYSLMRGVKQETETGFMQNLAIKAEEGYRIANIAAGEKNVFGKIAHERYMRKGQKQVTIEALPREGVHIDIRIHPPEIHIEARGVTPK